MIFFIENSLTWKRIFAMVAIRQNICIRTMKINLLQFARALLELFGDRMTLNKLLEYLFH